MLSKRL